MSIPEPAGAGKGGAQPAEPKSSPGLGGVIAGKQRQIDLAGPLDDELAIERRRECGRSQQLAVFELDELLRLPDALRSALLDFVEPIAPGWASDDESGEPDDQVEKPTRADRFIRLCWHFTDTANDAIGEPGAGTDAQQVLDRLRLLVPEATKSLDEAVLVLQIAFPAAMNPAGESSSDEADPLAGPGHTHHDQTDSGATRPTGWDRRSSFTRGTMT
jgi:hypothetical protein